MKYVLSPVMRARGKILGAAVTELIIFAAKAQNLQPGLARSLLSCAMSHALLSLPVLLQDPLGDFLCQCLYAEELALATSTCRSSRPLARDLYLAWLCYRDWMADVF